VSKSTKAVVSVKAGEETPAGFVQPKKGIKMAVNPQAISDPEKFIANKHREEQNKI
jgi:hypothetical protein